MKTSKCIAGISGLLLMIGLYASVVHAQNILNPFYTAPAWKLWYEDATPPSGITPPLIVNWLFPDDADTVSFPGRFLSYRNTDWPRRRYAGFWYDVYSSWDTNPGCSGPHSYIQPAWSGGFGNSVTLRPPDRHMHRWDGCTPNPLTLGYSMGVLWTS